MPVEIPLGERRVVPRQRRQHLLGIARRRLVGLTRSSPRARPPPSPPCASAPARCAPAHASRPGPPARRARAPRNTGSGDRATARPRPRRPSPRRGRRPAAPRGRDRAPSSPRTSSPSIRRVVISRCACQFARRTPPSPSCGACTSSCTARPLATKCSAANERASSTRSSSVSSAFAGSASTISRATCASLRRSAASAAFHSSPRRRTSRPAPSGSSTSWCSGASRWLK